jgi:FMN phosphatase YigB (HAD superfamily)
MGAHGMAFGLKTALLSNMHLDMAPYARRTFGCLQRLDFSAISCEVRLIKPERAIYEAKSVRGVLS